MCVCVCVWSSSYSFMSVNGKQVPLCLWVCVFVSDRVHVSQKDKEARYSVWQWQTDRWTDRSVCVCVCVCVCGSICAVVDVCHNASWETSVSLNRCHSTASAHLCVHVCRQLTICLPEHDERYDRDMTEIWQRTDEWGRQTEAELCNKSYMWDFNEELCVISHVCTSLVVHWVWLSWSPLYDCES